MNTRNKFLTVLFSFLPGAGHMFLGFMKTGLSFMTMFFGIIVLAVILRMGVLMAAMPIIWFYAFFDCINKTFPTDEANIIEDKYILLPEPFPIFVGKQRVVLGTALALLGLYLLADSALNIARRVLPYWTHVYFNQIRHFLNSAPQIIIAVAIIVVGVLMVVGKKKELKEIDDK